MIGQESRAVNILWGIKTRGILGSARREIDEPIPKAKAIGMPIIKRIAMEKNRIRSVVSSFYSKIKIFNVMQPKILGPG